MGANLFVVKTIRIVVAWLVACALLAPGARATETTASRTQAALWSYGDASGAWSGADGAYSVPLPDGRVAWIFSDTFYGEVDDEARTRSTSSSRLIRNSLVVQDADGTFTRTIAGSDGFGRPASAVQTESESLSWYWMGDGTVEGDKLHVFALRFGSVPPPFQQYTDDIATFSLPDLAFEGITRLPLGQSPAVGATLVGWGAAIMESETYTYVYGLEDLHSQKYLHLARARAGALLEPWEYWTGAGWSANPLLSTRLLDGISNEFSVHATPGGYTLVAQDHGIRPQVIACRAPAPQGPWGSCATVYTTPETAGSVFTYNAKAQPHLSDGDHLTISYNVNTTVYLDHFRDVDIYRPRFVEVPLPAGF